MVSCEGAGNGELLGSQEWRVVREPGMVSCQGARNGELLGSQEW